MKRISMAAACAVAALTLLAGTGAASANPGASAQHAKAVTKSEWNAEYDAAAYYGPVKCHGKITTNKKYPGGREVETCEAVGGTLTHMKAGKAQKAFENSEAGFVEEWESDSGSGLRTTNYSYKVNNKLTKFKLVAIYPAPEV